jgi:CubicO group peptidase (beta-lactamase class C family)
MDELASHLDAGIGRGEHIGYQLAVMRGDSMEVDLAGGLARENVAMTTTHAVRWLCCSKPAVAIAVVELARAGAISLDAPVADVLPDFGVNGKHMVTPRQLLLHTVPFERGPHRTAGVSLVMADEAALYPMICEMGLHCAPGTVAHYSSLNGWQVLGELIAAVTGENAGDHVEREVLSRVGATESTFGLGGRDVAALPVLFTCEGAAPVPAAFVEMPRQLTGRWPGFGARGPMTDLARMMAALLGGSGTFHPETVRQLTRPSRVGMRDDHFPLDGRPSDLAWGLGVMTDPRPFGEPCSAGTFGHLGYMSVFAFADPESELVVACHFNGVVAEQVDLRRRRALVDLLYRRFAD